MAGGILGILFGVASSLTITRVLGWSILISPVAVVAAVVFSVGIFVLSGKEGGNAGSD